MSITLRLGKVDQGAKPTDISNFFSLYHASMADSLKKKNAFRDEGDGIWRSFSELNGHEVKELQQFLKDSGFMPKSNVDGIFGYVTQAATRLFQEYIRTVEGDASIGTPDGIVGKNTWKFINQWKQEKQGKPEFVCKWGRSSTSKGSDEFRMWKSLIGQAKQFYLKLDSHPILRFIQNYDKKTDTLKIQDWDTSDETIHLIGIRRNQDMSIRKRTNDDLFVLLINGMVFKFWGSTDPSESMAAAAGRSDEPFLLEGQHVYKFGWHKVSSNERVYRALRPTQHGVLVFRDRNNDNALTQADIAKGLDKPNTTINIHWSGKGHTNYSAGCQVVSGRSYIGHDGKVVDCSKFASPGYSGLSAGQTRGAYNVLTDLILNYATPGVHTINYTLARDETFLNFREISGKQIEDWVKGMKGG